MKNSSFSGLPETGAWIQAAECFPPCVGQLVHALAAAVPRHRVTGDEAVALQASERHIDLARVQRQQIAELLLQRLLQLIAVSALAAQQCEEEAPAYLTSIYSR